MCLLKEQLAYEKNTTLVSVNLIEACRELKETDSMKKYPHSKKKNNTFYISIYQFTNTAHILKYLKNNLQGVPKVA